LPKHSPTPSPRSFTKILKIVFVIYAIFVIGSFLIILLFQYPNYLLIIPKINFRNSYYDITICSFIIDLKIDGLNIPSYYRITTCEENYKGKWELEQFLNFTVLTDNSTHLIVKSYSDLYTEHLIKTWTFHKLESYFIVNITRLYFVSDWNMNNQIIFDVQNKGYLTNTKENQNVLELEVEPYFSFILTNGKILTFRILNANFPLTIQYNNVSEMQFDFNDQGDRTLLFHEKGTVETVIVKVIIET